MARFKFMDFLVNEPLQSKRRNGGGTIRNCGLPNTTVIVRATESEWRTNHDRMKDTNCAQTGAMYTTSQLCQTKTRTGCAHSHTYISIVAVHLYPWSKKNNVHLLPRNKSTVPHSTSTWSTQHTHLPDIIIGSIDDEVQHWWLDGNTFTACHGEHCTLGGNNT